MDQFVSHLKRKSPSGGLWTITQSVVYLWKFPVFLNFENCFNLSSMAHNLSKLKNKLSLTVSRSGKAAEPSSSVLLVAKRKQKTENLTFSVQNTELDCVVFSKGKVSKHAKH